MPTDFNDPKIFSGTQMTLQQVLNSAAVKHSINQLVQTKYRQGQRNTKNERGQDVYVATPEDILSCLPHKYKPLYQVEVDRLQRLAIAGSPYLFELKVTTTEYILYLKPVLPNSGIPIARRVLSIKEVEAQPDQEQFFLDNIHAMKRELGWQGGKIDKDFLDREMVVRNAIKEAREASANEPSENKKPTQKPKKLPLCPEHGNPLEPRAEGVLGCPIPDCAVELRRKPKTGADFKRSGEMVPPPFPGGLVDGRHMVGVDLGKNSALDVIKAIAKPHLVSVPMADNIQIDRLDDGTFLMTQNGRTINLANAKVKYSRTMSATGQNEIRMEIVFSEDAIAW